MYIHVLTVRLGSPTHPETWETWAQRKKKKDWTCTRQEVEEWTSGLWVGVPKPQPGDRKIGLVKHQADAPEWVVSIMVTTCFLSSPHSSSGSQSSRHTAKATFLKIWWSSSKMKHSSSSCMTRTAKGRARMCFRTYRGRWPLGFSPSTYLPPRVPWCEMPPCGKCGSVVWDASVWQMLPRSKISGSLLHWLHKTHIHKNCPWRLFLLG